MIYKYEDNTKKEVVKELAISYLYNSADKYEYRIIRREENMLLENMQLPFY